MADEIRKISDSVTFISLELDKNNNGSESVIGGMITQNIERMRELYHYEKVRVSYIVEVVE